MQVNDQHDQCVQFYTVVILQWHQNVNVNFRNICWWWIELQFSQTFVKMCQNTYRPGQPNWENTIWKYHDFSATQIFREINFSHSVSQKTANLTICSFQV